MKDSKDLDKKLEVLTPEVTQAKKVKRDKEIVPYDSLTAFLREIKKYPKLTREEEHDLAVQFHKHKDTEAAYKLVTSNLWLVVKIARDYERAAKNILDLIQEGNIGLFEAVKNFNPYKGVRLPTYATWWIKAYIIRYVIANWRMVKIGTTQAQRKLFFNLQKEKEKLEREGFYPEPKLIAEKLDVKESEVVEMEQRLGSSDLSVDAPLMGDSVSDLHSILPDEDPGAEEILAKKQIKKVLNKAIKKFSNSLNKREKLIFDKRLINPGKMTLKELSEKINVSIERTRQIEQEIKESFKSFMEKNYKEVIKNLEFD